MVLKARGCRRATAYALSLLLLFQSQAVFAGYASRTVPQGNEAVGAGGMARGDEARPSDGSSGYHGTTVDGIFLTGEEFSLFAGDGEADHDGYLVRVKEDSEYMPGRFGWAAQGDGIMPELVTDGLYRVEDLEQALALADMGVVGWIQPNYRYYLLDDGLNQVNDPQYKEQWGLRSYPGINAMASWTAGLRGRGSKIAVLDTGCLMAHEDLNGLAIKGYNAHDEGKPISDTDNPGHNGHGTFVTGIIAAQTNNQVGVAGIADKAEILVVKVLSQNSANTTHMILAIEEAEREGVDVINMSLGSTNGAIDGGDRALKEAVDEAASKGIICVAAVGNYNASYGDAGKKWECAPAKFDSVIGVGSIRSNGGTAAVSSFSQRNNVTVAAPGDNIYGISHAGASSYIGSQNGTSFSAPVVSAMAGIAKGYCKSITKAGFESLLAKTSYNFISPGDFNGDIGYGTVDMAKFVEYLTTRYAISYEANGGVAATRPAYYFLGDSGQPLSPATRAGFVFKGWYGNPELSGAAVAAVPAGSVLEKRYYAKWATAPALLPGSETQTGTAVPSSPDGTVPAKPYEVDMAAWFNGDVASIVYGITSCSGVNAPVIAGSSLTYTPGSADAGKTITIIVESRYSDVSPGLENSVNVGTVAISLSVGATPANASTGNSGGSGGGGGGASSASPPETKKETTPAAVEATAGAIGPGTTRPGFEGFGDAGYRGYDDVQKEDWYYDAVRFVTEKGYFEGVSEGLFAPGMNMTRAMFVTALARFAGAYANGANAPVFYDVSAEDWFAASVDWAYRNGIAKGVGEGYFGPLQAVTREQMAVMVYNYLKYADSMAGAAGSGGKLGAGGMAGTYWEDWSASGAGDFFSDAGQISNWAVEALFFMKDKGLILGKPGNLADPQGYCNRGEAATIFMRVDGIRAASLSK